jgi:hypothetical protein
MRACASSCCPAHASRGRAAAEGGAPPGVAKRGPCPRKGPRTHSRPTKRIPCSSDCAGRRWTSGSLPESSSGAPPHANTHLHANNRQGLERPSRYGARGALAMERLSRAEDGRIAWCINRPLPDGTTRLLFTGLEPYGVWRPWCLLLWQTSRGSTASSLQATNCGHLSVLAYAKGAPEVAHGMCELGPGTRATPVRVVLRLKTAKRSRPLPRT